MDNLKSFSVRALDWHDSAIDPTTFMHYPEPRYPNDWNYSGYTKWRGNAHIPPQHNLSGDSANPLDIQPNENFFLPPFQVLTPEMIKRLEDYASGRPGVEKVIPTDFSASDYETNKRRRITDVFVSIPPVSADSNNYFAWPVWARYKDESRFPHDVSAGNFWGQQSTDDGIIWEFDGTKYLQERDIILQARVNVAGLSGFNNLGLSLFYAFNVPEEWRNPAEIGLRGRGSGGLWLPREPNLNTSPLFNIVPTKPLYPGSSDGRLGFYPDFVNAPVMQARPLFTFDLVKEGHFHSGGKIDFLLRFEGIPNADPNLFIARLDAKPGEIPGEWWKLIRPFSFDLQEVRLQRGGVTVLNNVINSDNRELCYIRFHLLRPGRVTVQVYTMDGTLVKSLIRNQHREAGEWTEVWDGSNNAGRPVARGMYFVRVVAPDINEIRNIMVIR
jgi:hypothetical protein